MNGRIPGLTNDDGNGHAPLMNDEGQGDLSGTLGVALDDRSALGRIGSGRHSGSLILLLVISIAGAGLWFMRKIGTSQMPHFDEVQIDYPIDDLPDGTIDTSSSDLLTQLASSGQVVQVPLDQVGTNPFVWKGLKVPEHVDPVSTGPQVDPVEQARLAREKELDTAFSKLRLNSVIEGSIPVARISGELVRIGDSIGEFFTVRSIKTRRVDLVADEKVFVLIMGE